MQTIVDALPCKIDSNRLLPKGLSQNHPQLGYTPLWRLTGTHACGRMARKRHL